MNDKERDKRLTSGSVWESLGRSGWRAGVFLVDRWGNTGGEGPWYAGPTFYFQVGLEIKEEERKPHLEEEETGPFL